jgi:hypothetical protein
MTTASPGADSRWFPGAEAEIDTQLILLNYDR